MWECCCCSYSSLALLAVIGYFVLRYIWELIPLSNLSKKAVFITGCDSGFGQLLAVKCLRAGMTVFATCLTESGESELRKRSKGLKGHLETLNMDVTKDDQVNKAAKFVQTKLTSDTVLWALVNNAGVFNCYGPDDWCSLDEYKSALEVNTLGVIRMTHALKPLLKKSHGRIVTVTSMAGRLSLPCGAPYSCAKYATEAYMDAIRQELYSFGVTCHILEPGVFKSTALLDRSAMDRRIDMVWQKCSQDTRNEYGEAFRTQFAQNWHNGFDENGSDRVDFVVDNYYHAITAKYPRLRYPCGWDAVLFYQWMSLLPAQFADAFFRLITRKNRPIPAALLTRQH